MPHVRGGRDRARPTRPCGRGRALFRRADRGAVAKAAQAIREDTCPVTTFSERHELLATRSRLTRWAIVVATDALAHDDTTVSALGRHLEVDWHTCWYAIEVEAKQRFQGWGAKSLPPNLEWQYLATRAECGL